MRTALVLLVVLAAASILGSLFPRRASAPSGSTSTSPTTRPWPRCWSGWGCSTSSARPGTWPSTWPCSGRWSPAWCQGPGPCSGCSAPARPGAATWPATAPGPPSTPPRPLRLDWTRPAGSAAASGTPTMTRRVRPEGSGEPRGVPRSDRKIPKGCPVYRELAGEKGYLREAASMLFHVSLLVLLVGLAYGKGYGYRGRRPSSRARPGPTPGSAMTPSAPAASSGPSGWPPSSSAWTTSPTPSTRTTPRFASRLTALDLDGRELQSQRVAPNRPMTVDGVDLPVRLRLRAGGPGPGPGRQGPGRRPGGPDPARPGHRVVDRGGQVTSSRPQVGLELTMFTGLVTAPHCPGGAPFCNDPGWSGRCWWCWPTRATSRPTGPRACSPSTALAWSCSGTGRCCSSPAVQELASGMVVSFTGLKQYSVFTLARDQGVPVVAVAAGLLLCGLVPSLYVTRRRVWVRAVPDGAGGSRSAGRPGPPGQGRLRAGAGPARGADPTRPLVPLTVNLEEIVHVAGRAGHHLRHPGLAGRAQLRGRGGPVGLEFAYGTRWFGAAGLTVTVAANVGAAAPGWRWTGCPGATCTSSRSSSGSSPWPGSCSGCAGGPRSAPRGVRAAPGRARHGPGRPGLPGPGRPARAGAQLPLDRDPWPRPSPAPRWSRLAAVFSVLYLVKERMERRQRRRPRRWSPGRPRRPTGSRSPGGGPPRGSGTGCRRPTPGLRTTAFGFPIWTFAIIAGAIWARRPGALLGLGPQGDLVVHQLDGVRGLPPRQGHRRQARPPRRLAIIGLGTLLFNFYAVNTVIVGLHSYGGQAVPPVGAMTSRTPPAAERTAQGVQRMFDRVAWYDLANTVFSMGQDKGWRQAAARATWPARSPPTWPAAPAPWPGRWRRWPPAPRWLAWTSLRRC